MTIDDVCSKDFLKSLVVQVPSNVDLDLDELHTKFGRFSTANFSSVFGSKADSSADLLPSGPYFLQGKNIHQAWKL